MSCDPGLCLSLVGATSGRTRGSPWQWLCIEDISDASARAAVLAGLCLSVGSPAVRTGGSWPGPSGAGRALRFGAAERASSNPRVILPSVPRWGGGPPPPGPFDGPIPGTNRGAPLRPGRDAFRAAPHTYGPGSRRSDGLDGRDDWRDGRFDGHRDGKRRHGRPDGVMYPTLGAVYIGASPYYSSPRACRPCQRIGALERNQKGSCAC